MSDFEYYFSFMGLILGLSLANVAVGFGRLWRARSVGTIGWCIPLIAMLVLARVLTLWIIVWNDLQDVQIGALSLILALSMGLPYVLISTLMFPDDSRDWPNLDHYYIRHARILLITLALPALAGLTLYPLVSGETTTPWDWVRHLSLLVVPLVIMLIWRRLWLHRILLAFMLLDEVRFMAFQA